MPCKSNLLRQNQAAERSSIYDEMQCLFSLTFNTKVTTGGTKFFFLENLFDRNMPVLSN